MRPLHKGFPIGESLAIAVSGTSEIILLDPMAKLIWEALYQGFTAEEIANLLSEGTNISAVDALLDVSGIIGEWQRSNLLVEPKASTTKILKVGQRIIALENQCSDVGELIANAVNHLEVSTEHKTHCLFQLLDKGETIDLIKNGKCLFSAPYADAIAQRLIYEIVEEGYRHLDFITVLHAAALKWKGHCFVMPAKGGSGKTTLAAALMHQGAEYLADDVVPLLSKEGDICPLRTSLCLKEHSWKLLQPSFPFIANSPILMRDGNPVRFLPPSSGISDEGEKLTTQLIIFPKYKTTNQPKLQPLNSVDTLKKLISNSTWFGESVTNNRLEELVYWCNSADAYEMSFDNLENGIYLLNGLLDKKNQHS